MDLGEPRRATRLNFGSLTVTSSTGAVEHHGGFQHAAERHEHGGQPDAGLHGAGITNGGLASVTVTTTTPV